MSAEDLEQALTPFGQVESDIAREQEGTGLGLPLSKHLVELHGGSLTIESKPGAGTTVRATFPAERLRHGDQIGPDDSGPGAEAETGEGPGEDGGDGEESPDS
jgi:signal transduction histidine kinase